MADNITYRFIQNVGDYFPSGYFTEDFAEKVRKSAGKSVEEIAALNQKFGPLRTKFDDYKNFIVNAHPRTQDAIERSHKWHTELLKVLGYDTDNAYQEPYVSNDKGDITEIIPVRHILRSGDKVSMLIMEMQNQITVNETVPPGLFEQQYDSEPERNTNEQRYYAGQWKYVIPEKYLDKEKYKFSPSIINKAITQLFLMPQERRPQYILMLAGNEVFLFEQEKWSRGSYLQFSLDELFTEGQVRSSRNHYALFQLLVGKESLSADGQTVLMNTLIEDSYKNAYEVTKDLKEGVVLAVETLANEALYYMRNVANKPFGVAKKEKDGSVTYDETDDKFEAEVKDDCLTIVYRLLFILFAESRPELGILPMGDEVYKRGYSFEALRDLEQERLISDESRNGYFFDDSIHRLFDILSSGYNANTEPTAPNKSFYVRPIDSPIFNDKKLHHLQGVKVRNVKWQEIIRALSLSHSDRYCGRISYANLGVNQLGSVYESLLAYRGFYAEQDYIEVHEANHPENGTYLVPYSRMEAFDINTEVLRDKETGEVIIIPKGTFIYRLNGRDRQKSASYYTPEVLTRSTVKYTIKAFVDEVRDGKRKPAELLDLKILEPAVGASAFLNEVINQLVDAYMTYIDKKPSPDKYRDELQKVKAYIATHNVYGVDLNPTAIELGKLSLWLNVIHKDMETPFFANRLAVGNAVVGAWLKVYSKEDVLAKKEGYKLIANKWWEKAPHKVRFYSKSVNRHINDIYHFLLPDPGMLAALEIREMRNEHKNEAEIMRDIKKDWLQPIGEYDFKRLQRISSKIDLLLREAFEAQVNIERLTNNRKDIWPHLKEPDVFPNEKHIENYEEKQKLCDTRNGRNNAYYKLRMVMDYWCSLWFWGYDDALMLPTRNEFWQEIENLLDVKDEELDNNTRKAIKSKSKQQELNLHFLGERMTEEEANIVQRSKEDILVQKTSQLTLFEDEEPERFRIAKKLAERYHFFHPMLDFIDVFWLRDGFDIICGNPPWIKLQFDDKAVMSERYPEVIIHRMTAPQVRAIQVEIMKDKNIRSIYESEQIENECSSFFLNAYSNYPLLVGQQTNLYKCVLVNCFDLINENGFTGLLTPDSIYDDPKGKPLRKELYKRLRYHFQYQNELRLFAEVHHHTVYGDQLLGPYRSSSPRFASISNLFHPNTVDACFVHDGHGVCGGIKENGKWNTAAHLDRIVWITEKELSTLAKIFENSDEWESTKLVGIHSAEIMKVLETLSGFHNHLGDFKNIITRGLEETSSVDNGIIIRKTSFPEWNNNEMIFSGPHINVGNPLYKTPRRRCVLNSDYDNIDLTFIDDIYSARTNYVPVIERNEYKNLIKGFQIGQDKQGKPIYEKWINYYKVGVRRMTGGGSGERTLTSAILPPESMHIGTITSTTFQDKSLIVEYAGLAASIILDFFIRTIGCSDIHPIRVESFPLGINNKFKQRLFSRTLRLNCITRRYSNLWEESWDDAFIHDEWSVKDSRLSPWNVLTPIWQHSTPLRNYFERRMALVEIDVISAMGLGLNLHDIESITFQFPVLQQNENDTWYDAQGNIVFTCSKGMTGVGLKRQEWEAMRGDLSDDKMTYSGATTTYENIVDPQRNELYGGKHIIYYAPYTRCDRIADYRRAWEFFEKRYKDE
ncbi:MAG: type II restriction endonuclease subunit M [Prevotella sp.]|nr:type II restriction endonuclease subunit M [Prevotella sp.]